VAARDRAVAAALAVGEPAAAPRRRWGAVAVGAVAAAVILLVVVVAATRSGTGNRSTGAQIGPSTSAPPAAARAGGGPSSVAAAPTTIAGPGGSVAAASSAASPPAGVPFLGSVDDAAGVRPLVETRSSAATTAPAAGPSSVPGVACAMSGARLMGAVTWDGVSALLYVTDDGRAVLVQIDGCGTLTVIPLG